MFNALRAIRNPLLVLLLTLAFEALAWLRLIPPQGEVLETIGRFVVSHGTPAILALSFLENVVVLNGYFPGSIAILAAMASTKGDPASGVLIWLAICAGSISGQIISFMLGARAPASELRSSKHFFTTSALTYWHPQLGSITSFSAGASRMKFILFLSIFLPIHMIWNLFWGLLMFLIGSKINLSQDGTYIILFIICVWIFIELFVFMRRSDR